MLFGARVKLSRIASGLSIAELADRANIPESILDVLESGEREPSDETVHALSQALNLHPSYLFSTSELPLLVPATTRISQLPEDEQDRFTAQARVWADRFAYYENEILRLRPGMFPERTVISKAFPRYVESGKEAAKAAGMLRTEWRVGKYPIKAVSDVLETNGVRVGYIGDVAGLDAVAMHNRSLQQSWIFVSSTIPGDQQRFGLVRELAHLLFENLDPAFAGHFAGAFLVPEEEMRKDIGPNRSNFDALELYTLKHKYGISMHSLLARAATLGLLPADAYHDWHESLHDGEPGYPGLTDYPTSLHRMIGHLRTAGIIDDDQGNHLYFPWVDMNVLLNLPEEE